MGPSDTMPEFEAPPFAPNDKANVAIVKVRVPCNWAQILEGAIDSAHSSSLHSTDIPPGRTEQTTAAGGVWARPTTDKSPRIQVQLTNYGFRYAAIRRPIKNSQTHDYVRITAFVAPITVLIPPNNVYSLVNVNVPEDDTHTTFYFIAWSDWGPGIDTEAFRKFCAARVGIDLDRNHRRIRTRENNYLQDRKAMKLGDYTGIPGIPNQDMAMWETMGPIADRTQRAARRERHRDRAVPARHGRRGQALRERRAGDRHDRTAPSGGERQIVRGNRAEGHRLADAWRFGGRARDVSGSRRRPRVGDFKGARSPRRRPS